MKSWINSVVKKNTEFNEIREFFGDVIQNKKTLSNFWEEQNNKAIIKIRIGHLVATTIFLFFGFFDYFIIHDKALYLKLTVVRIIILFVVLIPFYLLICSKNAKKIIQPFLFITYLVFGGYIVSLSYFLPIAQSGLFHNFVGLILVMIGLFLILTYRIAYTVLLYFILLIGYNVIFFYKTYYLVQIPMDLAIMQMLDHNLWFFAVGIMGFLIYQYSLRMNQINYVSRQTLISQRNELNKANQVKTKFFSLISHDLKNLIASQYSLSDLLLERYHVLPEEKRLEIIRLCHKSSERTLEMFNELQLWAKSQSNQISIEPENLNMKLLIHEVIELMQIQATTKNITIEPHISEQDTFFVDKNAVKTVLRNVIGNAIKFSFPNGRIIISNKSAEQSQIIKIEDFGVGMDEQTQNSMFQVDKTISQRGTNDEEGTGLGLILCRELLKLNKGNIWVDTELGKGTKVYFSLPKGK